MIRIAHVTASPFFGGPERQMLELARTFQKQARDIETLFVSFPENGNARPFLEKTENAGFRSIMLKNDMPHLWKASRELSGVLRENGAQLVFLHGHKARTVGCFSSRKIGIPKIGVSRGWTTENWKIAIYTKIDKFVHRRMDHVVCVSQGQADKVVKSGTPVDKVTVIHNSIRTERFEEEPLLEDRMRLEAMFAQPPQFILGDAGRLSPEKGFDVLLKALSQLVHSGLSVGLVLFGEGFLLEPLQKLALELDIVESVVFAGFTDRLDRFMPHFDIFVQSSHTEGLPNVVLEAMAARVAVVATDVGGTSEVVQDGKSGILVPPNNPEKIAEAVRTLLKDNSVRKNMARRGRFRVEENFTFEAQADAYCELIEKFT